MAASTESQRSIEIGLSSLRLMVLDLPELAEEWEEITGAERASWAHDWDQVIAGDLRILDDLCRSGRLSTEQVAQFKEVLRLLDEAAPLIERLQLYPPEIVLKSNDAEIQAV